MGKKKKSNRQYLFCWDKIPNDKKELKTFRNFLKKDFDIDWVKKATPTKPNGLTIKVSYEKNKLSLKLDKEKTKVTLKIGKGKACKTYKLTANEDEKGELNIYRPAIFIRHTQTATIFHNPDALEELWKRKLIAIDFGNNKNTNQNKAKGWEKSTLNILDACCKMGAIVCAEYSYSKHKDKPIRKMFVGEIRKGQQIKSADSQHKKVELKGKVYLFCWDDTKHKKLKEVLFNEYGFDWLKDATVESKKDKKSITVSARPHKLSLKLNGKKVIVTSTENGVYNLMADKKEDKVNIYGNRINRTVYLNKWREIKIKKEPYKYMLLTAIRQRLLTCARFNPRSAKTVNAIFNKEPLLGNVDSLHPEQLEVICYEWLKREHLLDALLMPIGGHIADVDIYGLKDGRHVFAQVTHSDDASERPPRKERGGSKKNKIDEKLDALALYKGKKSVLFFFCPEDGFNSKEKQKKFKKKHKNIQYYTEDDFKSKNGPKLKNKHKSIHVIPTEWVFDKFKGERMIKEMLLSK